MRSHSELIALIDSVTTAAEQELGLPLEYEEFAKAFEAVKQERYIKFLYKRIGHLPDIDYLNFVEILKNPSSPPEAPKEEPILKEVVPSAPLSLETPINENQVRRGRGRPKTKVG